jgi:hypothetical protein
MMNRHTVALNLLQIGEAEPLAVAIGTPPIGLMGYREWAVRRVIARIGT